MTVPISAWVLSSWYDLKSARTGDPRDPYAADGALRVGIAVAVLAGATGIAQFLYTRDETRRETAVHAALNNGAFTLYLLSLGLRRIGRRRLARTVSATAVGIVAASGYLGGDLSYRHGVGVTGTRMINGDARSQTGVDDLYEPLELERLDDNPYSGMEPAAVTGRRVRASPIGGHCSSRQAASQNIHS